MLDKDRKTCDKAISILRETPYDHPYRKIRMKYADLIEMQLFVGDPKYDNICVSLSQKIVDASAEDERADDMADYRSGQSARVGL